MEVSVFNHNFGQFDFCYLSIYITIYLKKHWLVKDAYSIKLYTFYSFSFQEFQFIYLEYENLMNEINF